MRFFQIALLWLLLALPNASWAQATLPDGIWSARFSCKMDKGQGEEAFAARLLTMSKFDQRAFFQLAAVAEPDAPPRFGLLFVKNSGSDGAVSMRFAKAEGLGRNKRFSVRSGSSDELIVDFGRCEGIRFERETPEPALPEAIGDWSGGFLNCGAWNAAADMTIVPAHDGNVFADIEYHRISPTKPGVDYPARNLLWGNWDGATQSFSMVSLQSLGSLRGGERAIARGWNLEDFMLAFDPETQRMSGRTRGCASASFSKTGSESSQAKDDLIGLWEGRTLCKDGTRTLSLSLDSRIGDQMNGTLEIAGSTAITEGVPKLSIVARRSPRQSQWEAAVAGVARDAVANKGPRSFTLTEGESTLHLAYDGGSCSETDLARVTEGAPSRVPTVAAPEGGTFFSGTSQQERCEAVVNWLGRMATEFPNLSLRKTPLGQVYPGLVLLFGDDDFVPLFGRSYDAMPVEERQKLSQNISQTCGTDPFYKDKLTGFSSVERGLRGAFDKPLTSFGAPAIVAAIRETRIVRHEINAQLEKIAGANTIEDAAPLSRALNALLANNSGRLWPSEIETRKTAATDRLAALALTDAERDFARIDALSDADAKLDALAVIANERAAYQKYLVDSERNAVADRAKKRQAEILTALLVSDLEKIESLADEMGSLTAFEEGSREITQRLAIVAPEVAKPFANRIDRKRQSILDVAVATMLAKLEGYEADLAGLNASADWIAAFETVFGPYKDKIAYQAVMGKFEEKREQLLTDALGQFEEDVAEAADTSGSAGVDAVMQEYLSWDGDENFPVWLEYDFVASGYR